MAVQVSEKWNVPHHLLSGAEVKVRIVCDAVLELLEDNWVFILCDQKHFLAHA